MSSVSDLQNTTSTESSTTETSSDSLPGLRAIAINFLTRVAYGRHTPFSISSSYRDSNKSLSYMDAIALVTDLLLAAAFVPSSILRLPFMPRLSKRLGQALVQLPSLTTDMLDQERLRLSDDVQNNIMTTLLRLSDQAKVDDRNHGTILTRTEKKHYLTENEIAGNLFILTAAGFDTTSNTMSYALVLLAAYPQWQAWIQAEIDVVLRDHDGHLAQEEYATIFPRLTRCLAIMFETLRLYPAVSMLIRTIDTEQTVSTSESSSFPLQAPCAVHVNTMALHTSHLEWGSDRLEFKPSRWLQSGTCFHVPHRGTYMPWSSGPRVCPGQKMSQVEFVSVIMTVFRSCSVEPVLEDRETMEQGRERLLDLLQDSQPVLTLQINRPKEVRLRWTRR
ncbi:cytochrome P450 [Fusarium flagelliforme]|uniref:cytochrome P450 n=1 Tax=Fusarium flagelliforme TaxID=2675880 RepID=UPI001E8D6D6F|nr:cytochrome P450 [Fusarium flagelliforme]KAH7192841.1 cytochrome P450 [Fusarium flagelliforme]